MFNEIKMLTGKYSQTIFVAGRERNGLSEGGLTSWGLQTDSGQYEMKWPNNSNNNNNSDNNNNNSCPTGMLTKSNISLKMGGEESEVKCIVCSSRNHQTRLIKRSQEHKMGFFFVQIFRPLVKSALRPPPRENTISPPLFREIGRKFWSFICHGKGRKIPQIRHRERC